MSTSPTPNALTIKDRIAAIEAGPAGPHVGAFFDLDGTLVAGYTGLHFIRALMHDKRIGARDVLRLARGLLDGSINREDVGPAMALGAHLLTALTPAELDELQDTVFRKRIARTMYWPALSIKPEKEGNIRLA